MRKGDADPNGTYLSNEESTIDRKLVTSANLKFVAPAKAHKRELNQENRQYYVVILSVAKDLVA